MDSTITWTDFRGAGHLAPPRTFRERLNDWLNPFPDDPSLGPGTAEIHDLAKQLRRTNPRMSNSALWLEATMMHHHYPPDIRQAAQHEYNARLARLFPLFRWPSDDEYNTAYNALWFDITGKYGAAARLRRATENHQSLRRRLGPQLHAMRPWLISLEQASTQLVNLTQRLSQALHEHAGVIEDVSPVVAHLVRARQHGHAVRQALIAANVALPDRLNIVVERLPQARELRRAEATAAESRESARVAAEAAKRCNFSDNLERFHGIFDYLAEAPAAIDTVMDKYRAVITPKAGKEDVWNPITERWNRAAWAYDPSTLKFTDLVLEARMALLMPFLKHWVGDTFPLLDLAHSSMTRLVYVAEKGPFDADALRRSATAINGFLGGEWSVKALDAQRVQLDKVHPVEPLPKVVRLTPAMMRAGSIFHGFEMASRQPYYVQLPAMRHTLVCGATWSGKTTGLHVIITSLLANLHRLEALHLVDYSKRGLEFKVYAGLSSKVHVYKQLAGDDGVWKLVANLVALMEARYAAAEQGTPLASNSFVVLVIDEAQAFWTMETGKDNPDADHVKAFRRHIRLLSEQARAANIKLVMATQQPTSESIPSNVMSNLTSRMIYKLTSPQVAQMLLGQTTRLPKSPQDLETGQYLFDDDSSGNPVSLVQTPFVAKADDPAPHNPEQFLRRTRRTVTRGRIKLTVIDGEKSP